MPIYFFLLYLKKLMGIESFFSKIGDGISSLAHSVGSTFGEGYQEFKNVTSSVGTTIETQATNVSHVVGNVVDKGVGLVNGVLKTGSDLIKHTEDKFSSIITMPLLLIAAGVGGLLLFNGDKVAIAAGTVASKMG